MRFVIICLFALTILNACKPAEPSPSLSDIQAKDELERKARSREAIMGPTTPQSKAGVTAGDALKK